MNYPQAQSVYQCYLALKLGMREFEEAGDIYGDFGCGTGGPTRMIAQFSGAKIVAVNINKMHLELLAKYNQEVCTSVVLRSFFSFFFCRYRLRLRIGSRRIWRTITPRGWRASR
jgi:SAM-dependent methyltransferase